ncbi:MAG TPA: cytochrome C oxidase subunit IV family protein [Anaeromyxobacteraceae bacterium]|jgi:cytochrome c oxidase subunit 4
MSHASRKQYLQVFLALALLTALEVGVVYLPAIGKGPMVLALVGLAVTKAALVGLFFMHLRYETRIMRLTVAIPLATPAIYAVVLIAEATLRVVP